MTNQQFLEDCKQKREVIYKRLHNGEQLPENEVRSLREQQELLSSAIKIMTYGTGRERRAFRRNYERRLGS